MKVYESANIRNVVLVGHQGAGKTMVSEAMLFASGAIGRMGSIADKSTVSDYHESEHQRGMSIFASLLHLEHENVKLNLLDTPGYPDFVGEVVASLRVADLAVFVLNATDPIQVGTDLEWTLATKAEIPVMFIVNHVDKPGVDFTAAVAKIQERFGRAATVLQIPGSAKSVVDLVAMKQFTANDKGKHAAADVDAALKSDADALRNTLMENVAENDEQLTLEYLEAGTLSAEQLMAGLRAAVKNRQMFPVLCTSAATLGGIYRALDLVAAIAPAPLDGRPMSKKGGGTFTVNPSGEPIAFCYRTLSEQHVGEFSFLKVCSGALETGMDLENAEKQAGERLGQLFLLNGKNRDSVPKLAAGDIGATVKLKDTHTNTTLHPKGSNVAFEPIEFPEPRYKQALHPVTAGEEDKLSTGLHKIVGEDPSLKIYHDSLLGQMLIGGQGEMHIEIVRNRLKSRFGVDVALSVPKVSYRETILKSGRASYRHKKQTGGAGQFADISMIVEPLLGEYHPPADVKVRGEPHVHTTEWGAKLEMIDAIVSGVIDMKRFASAIQKGVLETMRHGPLAGYPCGDIRVVVFDGKMHAVDSNENAFKTASRQCFKLAFQEASPVLLEPICDLEVLMPDEFTGDVMGDLNTRRARIQGMEGEGALQKITAIAPEVELLRYSTQLRSLTQGRGVHTAKFLKYDPMPRQVQDKVVAETVKAKEEEEH